MRETPAPPALATACFLHAGAADATFQNVQLSLNLGESCPVGNLQDAWQKVVASRAGLRSSFSKAATGETLHREHAASDLDWTSLDWTDVSPAEISARWQALLNEDAAQPFDLAAPPLLRFQAIALPGGHSQLLVTFPKLLLSEDALFHILCEWLEVLQGGQTHPAGDPEATPAASPATAEWWSRFFSKAPEALTLKIYPDRASLDGSFRKEHSALMDRETSREIKALCQRLGVRPRDAFLAVWSLVLSRLTAMQGALLLAPCQQSGLENLLPCRPAVASTAGVENWLREVSQSEKERAQNAGIGLERVLALAEPARRVRDFPAAFVWAPPPLNDRIHDVFPRWINFDAQIVRRSQFPLMLHVRDGDRFSLQMESDPTLCPPVEAEALLARVVRVMESLLQNPAQPVASLSILSAQEREALSVPPAADFTADKAKSVQKKIAAMAVRDPEALAITGLDEDAALSFAELDSHAKSLAAWLHNENLADGWNIAVCLSATPWLPVAVLGILRAGSTCVPLDATSPADWLSGKMESSDVEMIICDSRTAPLFGGLSRRLLILDQQWDAVAASTGGGRVAPQKIAFLLTGTASDPAPSLRSLSPDFLAAACRESSALWHIGPGDRIPLLAAPGTGAFVETLLSSLMAGATLLVADTGDPLDLIENGQPTHLRLSAGQWRVLTARLARTASSPPDSLRVVCVEIDDASPGTQFAWRALGGQAIMGVTFYSPAGFSGAGIRAVSPARDTERTAFQDAAIGFAGPGVTATLSDPTGQPLPPHYPGNLKISFSPDEADSHSHSIPAWRSRDGAFHFVPSDASAAVQALGGHPNVVDAHCSVVGGRVSGAWVILRPDASASTDQLLQDIARKLPEDQCPKFLLAVDEFPLTSGGAIHETELPQPSAPSSPSVAPSPQVRSGTPTPSTHRRHDWEPLVLLHKSPDTPLLFLVHDLEGHPEKYRPLARLLKDDWTLYGTTARGLSDPSACHGTVEAEAAALVEAICVLDPEGPFHLFGHGYGAVLAMEMARQLRIARRDVPYLALAGAMPPECAIQSPWKRALSRIFSFGSDKVSSPEATTPVLRAHAAAVQNHRAHPLGGPAGIILGTDMGRDVETGWTACAPEALFSKMSCPAKQMLTEPPVKRLAVILREWMLPSEDAR